MSELRVAAAERMSREVAVMGRRLAALIESSMGHDSAVAQGQAFLSAMFQASTAEPVADEETCPLDRLAGALALTARDLDLIVLAGMAEEHEGYASLLRSLNPRSEPRATAGLAAQLCCDSSRDRFAFRHALETGIVTRSGLVTLAGDAPLFEKNLVLAEGLWSALCGLDAYPASAAPIHLEATMSGLQGWLQSPDVVAATRALSSLESRVLLVTAETETIAAQRAAALVVASGRRSAAFDLKSGASTHRVALALALARGETPIFRVTGTDGQTSPGIPDVAGFPGMVIVCVRRGAVDVTGGVPVLSLDAHPLSPLAREEMWRDALPELATHSATLASRYTVEPFLAREVVRDLRARHRVHGAPIDLDLVADCIRVRSNLPITAGVTLVRATAKWEQLILPSHQKSLLVEALGRLTHQSTVLDRWRFLEGRAGARGVRVLMVGPPGTGKTLSAEVLARALGVDLMVVDISRVVSKWIGETEKHLAQIFDAAERAQAVLLFDEADALFGKRTEVSDAHDRYANLETAYLLSRLERFEGLAVLSTNLKQNIDPAFLRRVEFVIELDEPGIAERQALWRGHLPGQAPLGDDVDLAELAELYPIVGGLIRNASVAAGFLAAAGGKAIGRRHLIGAIQREYEKSAKAFPGTPEGVVPV